MTERLLRYASYALALMPVLGSRTMVAVIAVWTMLALLHARNNGARPARADWWWVGLLGAPFLLMLLDLPRSHDLRVGWRLAETAAALLVFPVVFLLLRAPADARLRRTMTELFSLAALALPLVVDLRLLVDPQLMAQPIGAPFSHRYREAFGAIGHVHAPFAAYYMLAAALFQLSILFSEARHRGIRIALVLALVISATLLASRMPLFAFVAAAFVMTARRWGLGPALGRGGAAACAALILFILIPTSRHRLRELLPTTTTTLERTQPNSVEIRGPVLHCSLKVWKAHWALGIGQAQVQPALDACYAGTAIPVLTDGSHSTHSQPLHWAAAFGLMGPVLFLLLFAAPFVAAWRIGDDAHIGLLFFIALCCLTENALSRQWGVVLFACFNTLFLASAPTPERRSTY